MLRDARIAPIANVSGPMPQSAFVAKHSFPKNVAPNVGLTGYHSTRGYRGHAASGQLGENNAIYVSYLF